MSEDSRSRSREKDDDTRRVRRSDVMERRDERRPQAKEDGWQGDRRGVLPHPWRMWRRDVPDLWPHYPPVNRHGIWNEPLDPVDDDFQNMGSGGPEAASISQATGVVDGRRLLGSPPLRIPRCLGGGMG